jgi:hypothetical protein
MIWTVFLFYLFLTAADAFPFRLVRFRHLAYLVSDLVSNNSDSEFVFELKSKNENEKGFIFAIKPLMNLRTLLKFVGMNLLILELIHTHGID